MFKCFIDAQIWSIFHRCSCYLYGGSIQLFSAAAVQCNCNNVGRGWMVVASVASVVAMSGLSLPWQCQWQGQASWTEHSSIPGHWSVANGLWVRATAPAPASPTLAKLTLPTCHQIHQACLHTPAAGCRARAPPLCLSFIIIGFGFDLRPKPPESAKSITIGLVLESFLIDFFFKSFGTQTSFLADLY